MGTLPLQIIADITVVTSSPQVAAPKFNIGLIIGSSTVIPSYGSNSRVQTFIAATWSQSMLTAGFTLSSPEYIAAQMYFSQSPQPQTLDIGRQDLTAIQTTVIDVAGTSWAVGDTFNIIQAGATYGVGKILAETAGVPSSISVLVQGTGYSVATGLTTTAISPSTGTGLTVSITAIGETCLQAAQACRLANFTWYPFMCIGAVDADHITISAWALTQTGTIYMGNSSDTAVQNGGANNLFLTLFNAASKRTWMQWSTTQSGLYPNQVYFTAAIMGQMMASNTQLANSAFTEKFSGGVPLVGVYTEPNLSTTQIANIEGSNTTSGPNGNLYLNYGNAYNVLEQGTMMAPAVFLDQILNLDVLVSNMQYSIMNLLTTVPKVPQNPAGQNMMIQAIEKALDTAVNIGFISSGVWEGQTILGLTAGTPLPTGYAVLTQNYNAWAAANPALVTLRQLPPFYVALIEAGAVHFVTVELLVQV